jgi:hypothetical protein
LTILFEMKLQQGTLQQNEKGTQERGNHGIRERKTVMAVQRGKKKKSGKNLGL